MAAATDAEPMQARGEEPALIKTPERNPSAPSMFPLFPILNPMRSTWI